jgi:hypothetical protein
MTTTVRKISLAIGEEALAWAEKRARRQKTSVSAVLTAAALRVRDLEAELERQDKAWASFLDEATSGRGLTRAQIARGHRELDGQ